MKLLIENWRQYVKESNYITLDEDSLGPQYLEYDLTENQNLKEEGSNELSIADLKEIKPEVIQSAYRDLHSKELEADQETREKTLTALAGSQAAGQGIKPEGGWDEKEIWEPEAPISVSGVAGQFINNVKSYINRTLGADLEITTTNPRKLTAIGQQIQDLFINEFTDLEREIIRSIFLFTGNSVPAVREPSRFTPAQAKLVRYVNDGIRNDFMPSRATYEKAKIILEALQRTPMENEERVMRGMAVPLTRSKFTPLEDYKIGGVINMGNIVSFTVDPTVAVDFAQNSWSEKMKGTRKVLWKGLPVVLTVAPGKLKMGADIDQFSDYEGSEAEVLTSGEFKITNMGYWNIEGSAGRRMGFKDFQTVFEKIKKISKKQNDSEFSFRHDGISWLVMVDLEQL